MACNSFFQKWYQQKSCRTFYRKKWIENTNQGISYYILSLFIYLENTFVLCYKTRNLVESALWELPVANIRLTFELTCKLFYSPKQLPCQCQCNKYSTTQKCTHMPDSNFIVKRCFYLTLGQFFPKDNWAEIHQETFSRTGILS